MPKLFHLCQHGLPGQGSDNILRCNQRHFIPGLLRSRGHVGRYCNIGQRQQRVVSRQGFRFRHVQTRRGNFSALQRFIQRICIYHFAPGDVYETHAVFHGGKSSFIKQTFGGRVQRNRHRDKIRSLQQLFPRYIPRA